MVKVRIPLTDENSFVTPVYDDTVETPETSTGIIPPESIEFSLDAVSVSALPDYNFALYAHPATRISVAVPDADLPIVTAWLGGTPHSGSPSETFVKRMTSAVTDAISKYVNAASSRNLFTSPFRIGYAVQMADGSFSDISQPLLLSPAPMAPLMPIRERQLSANNLITITEIINTPMRLNLNIKPFTPADSNQKVKPVSIVVFATRPVSLLDGSETVNGIRTTELYGEHVPSWSYNRLAEDLVRQCAEADSDFRVIAEVPIGEAAEGITGLTLPQGNSLLSDWNSLPKFSGTQVIPDGPDPSRLILSTVPLDLNRPEDYKKVRGVTLRGIFNRSIDRDATIITLYGSLHRERWHKVSVARGAHIRLLRAVAYRWYRVEIDVAFPATLDALTFEIN